MLRRLRWILWALVIVTLPCVVFVALRNGRDASGAARSSFGSLPKFQLGGAERTPGHRR